MAGEVPKMPRSEMNIRLRRLVKRLEKMSLAERIQIQVEAGLLGQEQADEALARYAASGEPAKQAP